MEPNFKQRAEIERVNALIAREWPSEWVKAKDHKKKRHALRKRWEYREAMQKLKAENPEARCANCASFAPMPFSASGRMMCEAESDFYGYMSASPDGLCLKWRMPLPAPPEQST